jgi:hypothetical protein
VAHAKDPGLPQRLDGDGSSRGLGWEGVSHHTGGRAVKVRVHVGVALAEEALKELLVLVGL